MQLPPTLSGMAFPGIDDEDDDAAGAGASSSGGAPTLSMPGGLGLSFPGSDDEDDDAPAKPPPKEDLSKTGAFMLSQSGAFKVSDFQIRPEGGLMSTIDEAADISDHAHPAELSASSTDLALQAHALEVTSLADLEMLNELGSGASGTVFKARHKSTGNIVAVKCVTILEKAKRDQVVSEIRLMRKHMLGAKWLVAMHNAFYEDAKVFTVLEMMDGGSVEDLVKKHSASGGLKDEAELARIGKMILEGLNYLHRQLHQVHRDLKPANVMMNAAGDVKIADFGISSQLNDTGAFCETFVGTTCYMSPERLSGEAYSYSADIWAFGLIMIELAAGTYPYPKPNSYFELLGAIMDNPPPEVPSTLGFSNEFTEMISLCLDKTPNLRPNARDLLKHPWFRQAGGGGSAANSPDLRGPPSVEREDSRHDRAESPLDRSRTNVADLGATLAGLKF